MRPGVVQRCRLAKSMVDQFHSVKSLFLDAVVFLSQLSGIGILPLLRREYHCQNLGDFTEPQFHWLSDTLWRPVFNQREAAVVKAPAILRPGYPCP
jgi:hypothetical protein